MMLEPEAYCSLSMICGALDLNLPLKIGSGLPNCINWENVLIFGMGAGLSLQEKGTAEASIFGGMGIVCLNTGMDQACTTAICIKQAERKEGKLSRSALLGQETSGFAAAAHKEQVVPH